VVRTLAYIAFSLLLLKRGGLFSRLLLTLVGVVLLNKIIILLNKVGASSDN
jgi:hypothetical protein